MWPPIALVATKTPVGLFFWILPVVGPMILIGGAGGADVRLG